MRRPRAAIKRCKKAAHPQNSKGKWLSSSSSKAANCRPDYSACDMHTRSGDAFRSMWTSQQPWVLAVGSPLRVPRLRTGCKPKCKGALPACYMWRAHATGSPRQESSCTSGRAPGTPSATPSGHPRSPATKPCEEAGCCLRVVNMSSMWARVMLIIRRNPRQGCQIPLSHLSTATKSGQLRDSSPYGSQVLVVS